MFFDTHAHYDDERYDADRDPLLEKIYRDGVELIVNPGCDQSSSEAAVALAERYPFIYAAVGWHPHEADSFCADSPEQIRAWAKEKKVRAIGEIGLDYHYDLSPRDIQRKVFIRQLELARELQLPVIIHDREAHGECMEILRSFPDVQGEFHCYSGSAEMAAELLRRDWYLGFNGAITFKNARKALEVLEITPMERILIETDAPYLTPVPHRGKRNDSRYLNYVAQTIGQVKNMSVEEIAAQTMKNGRRFFGITSQ